MARGNRTVVKLVSTADTGHVYWTNKNKRTTPDRLEAAQVRSQAA